MVPLPERLMGILLMIGADARRCLAIGVTTSLGLLQAIGTAEKEAVAVHVGAIVIRFIRSLQ